MPPDHLRAASPPTPADEFHWLRHLNTPEVLAHLKAEHAHAQAWFEPYREFRQALYGEMLGRIQEDDEEVPYRKGPWWYGSRTARGQQYSVYVRRRGTPEGPEGPEQVLLDHNALAEGRPFLELGDMEVSPDGRLLAFSVDETGALDYTLQVKNLDSGELLPVRIEKTDGVAWAGDSRTLFYLTKDHARRTHRVWRHVLGQRAGQRDELVYEERDELFWVGLERTRDGRFIVISSASKDTTELHVLDAARPASAPRRLLARRKGREALLEHRLGHFYLLVNDRGPNFRLVSMPVMRPSLATALEIVSHRPEVMLEGLDVFAGHLVLAERDRGVQRLQVFDLADGSSHPIALPEELCSVWTSDNEEFDTTQLRLSLTSLVTPESVFDYDMSTRVLTLRKREPVLGGYDPARYASCRMQAEAADGTWVPISLVWRRDLRAPGPQSLLLTGYGAYGVPHDVYFSSTRLSLLDRGVVVAFAHVRGGGDLGRTWYDAGKLAHKMNTFTDFIACAEHLVQAGWTAPAQLVIEGASAGGLLMGAVTNMRPELFRAVVAEVPFLDVIHTMLDESLPLTVGEFLEWGNPKKAADYRVMRAYSPYDNLQRGPYPAIYLRTSLHDSQVACWEPAKYAARLRTLKTDDNPLLLSINLEAGHGGASGRYDALHERAEVLTFMLAQWGLAHGPAPLPAGEKR